MTKWQQRFMELAHLCASWSKDPSTKVGAVIVDSTNRVISMGYNGPARFLVDEGLTREEKLMRTIHAEENAILFAHRSLENTSIYTTHHPCGSCAAKIAQTGIANVYFPLPERGFSERWADHINEAKKIFQEAQINAIGI